MSTMNLRNKLTVLFLIMGTIPLMTMALVVEIGAVEIMRKGEHSFWLMWITAGVCLIITIAGAFIFSRLITGFMKKNVSPLVGMARKVDLASSQVADSSQHLAERAGEQASSIEETSSSLEELASMTRQNAEHSMQASSLIGISIDKLKEANVSMKSLIDSMNNTSVASDNVSKIVKTIDEIAFQTNLLALNAAVEAARAGEAGAGFSVVAEEVRNLAQRSSEASLNTQELIRDVIDKIKDGTKLVDTTDGYYRDVAINVQKANGLMKEIASASGEQAQGIDQINISVAEMDKITQQNAATAEESADASEEMNVQAAAIESLVDGLIHMIAGTGRKEVAAGEVENPDSGGNGDALSTSSSRREAVIEFVKGNENDMSVTKGNPMLGHYTATHQENKSYP